MQAGGREVIVNLDYYIYEPNIKCPYCNKDCRDDDYIVELDAQIEFECEHCEKMFHVEPCIVYCTYSDCKLNGKEHDFEQSESHPTVFNCKNCYQHEVRE